jgi:hypothetical protein
MTNPILRPALHQFYGISMLIAFICLQSCNLHIEKRRYQKGYHVEWGQRANPNKTTAITGLPEQPGTELFAKADSLNQPHLHPTMDSILPKTPFIYVKKSALHKPHKKNQIAPSQSNLAKRKADCDLIRLWDGTQIEAIIVSMNSTEIGYKKCNFSDGPTYKISAGKVKEIETKNGEIIHPNTSNNPQQTHNAKVVTGGMIAGIILAILAFIGVVAGISIILAGLGFFNLWAAIPLAIAGLTSLVGFIISARYLAKGWHALGRVSFILNLIFQVLAIIFTVLMFFI